MCDVYLPVLIEPGSSRAAAEQGSDAYAAELVQGG
jgi:hypothetical protein